MAIELIGKIKPKNNGTFPMVDAADVEMPDGTRLGDMDLSAGKDGLTPYIGLNGNWWIGEEDTGVPAEGPQGEQGPQGEAGPAGADGHTPVKGEDYYTEADKQELIDAVLAEFTDVSEVGM